MVVKYKISLDRYEITKDGRAFDKKKNRWLKSFTRNDGYLYYCINDENGKHIVSIHRLLAQVYLDDWFDGCLVHHVDGNKLNNSLNNLKCISVQDHLHLHHAIEKEPITKVCPVCKSEFIWSEYSQKVFAHNNKYKSNNKAAGPFCSQKCALRYAATKRVERPLKSLPDYAFLKD